MDRGRAVRAGARRLRGVVRGRLPGLPAAEIDAVPIAQADAATWDPEAVPHLLDLYRATPEMLFHRLTQRPPPEALGLEELAFLRFHHEAATDAVTHIKTFHLSEVSVPYGVEGDEPCCRR